MAYLLSRVRSLGRTLKLSNPPLSSVVAAQHTCRLHAVYSQGVAQELPGSALTSSADPVRILSLSKVLLFVTDFNVYASCDPPLCSSTQSGSMYKAECCSLAGAIATTSQQTLRHKSKLLCIIGKGYPSYSHLQDSTHDRLATLRLPEREFHNVADTLLESLHENMDAVVEEEDIPGGDVEYGVCCSCPAPARNISVFDSHAKNSNIIRMRICAARSAYSEARASWDICVQQANPKSADLDVFASQVNPEFPATFNSQWA